MMKNDLEQQAETALLACLKDIPFLQVRQSRKRLLKNGQTPDLLARLQLPDTEQILIAEVKRSGQPRYAREAVNQLFRYAQSIPDAYGVLVAPYISPQAAAVCMQEGVGYVDLAGNCHLHFGQVYIHKEGNPNPFAQKRDLRSLYAPKASRVLRVLLTHPKQTWKVQALADEASVSLGQAANVKKLLADREWIQTKPTGFSLNEPAALLAEWAKNYDYHRNQVQDCYSFEAVGEIEASLATVCQREEIPYALTGFSGASRLAPAVRYQRATAYVQDPSERLVTLLNLKPVPSGANISLLTPYDAGVLYGAQDYDRIQVVSPIQLYLDLQGFRGRGEEAAQVLLEEVLKPQW